MDFLHSLSKDELIMLLVKSGSEINQEILESFKYKELQNINRMAENIMKRRRDEAQEKSFENVKNFIGSLLSKEEAETLEIEEINGTKISFRYQDRNRHYRYREFEMSFTSNFLQDRIFCREGDGSDELLYTKYIQSGEFIKYSDASIDRKFLDTLSANFYHIVKKVIVRSEDL